MTLQASLRITLDNLSIAGSGFKLSGNEWDFLQPVLAIRSGVVEG